MNPEKQCLTQDSLREWLDYNEITGNFVWVKSPIKRVSVGSIAGTVNKRGYRIISLGNKKYFSHRLVWLFFHGKWPDKLIDHINGMKDDNRISNLRDVSQSVNMQNIKCAYVRSRSGLLGASFSKSHGWAARIMVRGKHIHIGYYKSAELAHDAYLEVKRSTHSGCVI